MLCDILLNMSAYANNSIFWVETSKISPNPYQPRREFNEHALNDLADSIRQYGVLQPLVVTRKETFRSDGGMETTYELIAGERRLRAAQIASLQQVPVIIRTETDDTVKLELAIIENLQREDLNAIDRAQAFEQLHRQFNLTHAEIGKRMGKSRVYVSNSLRLLALPDEIKQSLIKGRISEGHTRPLLMLTDRPEEQLTLFREILSKNLSVRDAEKIARRVAQDKIRKKEFLIDPRIRDYEIKISENLGTRVQIEPSEKGGKIVIDYFSQQDLDKLIHSLMQEAGNDEHTSEIKDTFESTEAKTKIQETFTEQEINQENRQELSRSTGLDFVYSQDDTRDDYQSEDVLAEVNSSSENLVNDNYVNVPDTQEFIPTSDYLTGNPYQVSNEIPEKIVVPIISENSEYRNYQNSYHQAPQSQSQQYTQEPIGYTETSQSYTQSPQNYYQPVQTQQNVPVQHNVPQNPYYYQEPAVIPPKKKSFFQKIFG